MHPNTREHFVNLIDQIAEASMDDLDPTENDLFKMRLGEEGGFVLHTDAARPYRGALRVLTSTGDWEEKFSEKYIRKEILNPLIAARVNQSPDDFDDILSEKLEHLASYSTEQAVYVPISGITLSVDKLDLGRVELMPITEELVADIIGVDFDVLTGDRPPEEEKQAKKIQLTERLLEPRVGKVAAKYSVVAEPERAKERALDETRRVLDIIRYSIPLLYTRKQRVKVAIEGEWLSTTRVLPAKSEGGSFRLMGERTGALQPYKLDEDRIEKLEEIGVISLAEILKKDSPSDVEEVLIRGVHWLGVAQMQSELESSFLSLITAIETYLTPKDNAPITHAIAEGTAILIGSELEERRNIMSEVKSLYRKRSAVSHGGAKSIQETDLLTARFYALGLTQILISNLDEYTSHQDLFDQLEAKKLGSSASSP